MKIYKLVVSPSGTTPAIQRANAKLAAVIDKSTQKTAPLKPGLTLQERKDLALLRQQVREISTGSPSYTAVNRIAEFALPYFEKAAQLPEVPESNRFINVVFKTFDRLHPNVRQQIINHTFLPTISKIRNANKTFMWAVLDRTP